VRVDHLVYRSHNCFPTFIELYGVQTVFGCVSVNSSFKFSFKRFYFFCCCFLRCFISVVCHDDTQGTIAQVHILSCLHLSSTCFQLQYAVHELYLTQCVFLLL
jgi:hypothetical protein